MLSERLAGEEVMVLAEVALDSCRETSNRKTEQREVLVGVGGGQIPVQYLYYTCTHLVVILKTCFTYHLTLLLKWLS